MATLLTCYIAVQQTYLHIWQMSKASMQVQNRIHRLTQRCCGRWVGAIIRTSKTHRWHWTHLKLPMHTIEGKAMCKNVAAASNFISCISNVMCTLISFTLQNRMIFVSLSIYSVHACQNNVKYFNVNLVMDLLVIYVWHKWLLVYNSLTCYCPRTLCVQCCYLSQGHIKGTHSPGRSHSVIVMVVPNHGPRYRCIDIYGRWLFAIINWHTLYQH